MREGTHVVGVLKKRNFDRTFGSSLAQLLFHLNISSPSNQNLKHMYPLTSNESILVPLAFVLAEKSSLS